MRTALLLLLSACTTAPLTWEPALPDESVPADERPALATRPVDPRGGVMCEGSLRVAAVVGGAGAQASMHHAMPAGAAPAADSARVVAVWWSVRPDSTARLLSARGGAGGAWWEPAVPVDTVDRGAHGCTRVAPSVAWTASDGYVHVAYALDAPEGSGVFYAHSMLRGTLYDTDPQPIAYGPAARAAAVAARGDTVVVAYEDPNVREGAVALALSLTAGHGFTDKAIAVAGGAVPARAPAVALDAAGVVVRFREGEAGRAMRRAGRWVR